LSNIERRASRLAELVDRLLDVSAIARGRLDVDLEAVDLAALTREVVARFEPEAARAGIRVAIRAPNTLVGRWDRIRLDQALTNLLSNAIKYGLDRPVQVDVEREGPVARVRVQDHGI